MQYYLFRTEGFLHLRALHDFRYPSHQDTVADRQTATLRTDDNTIAEEDEGATPYDSAHRNFDTISSRYVEAGRVVHCARDLHVHLD